MIYAHLYYVGDDLIMTERIWTKFRNEKDMKNIFPTLRATICEESGSYIALLKKVDEYARCEGVYISNFPAYDMVADLEPKEEELILLLKHSVRNLAEMLESKIEALDQLSDIVYKKNFSRTDKLPRGAAAFLTAAGSALNGESREQEIEEFLYMIQRGGLFGNQIGKEPEN